MKNKIKSFESFVTNEKVGVISGIQGFNKPDENDSEETKAIRAKVIADMRKEVGSDLVNDDIEEEEETTTISVDSEENLPTIDIDKILYDYAKGLNQEEKKEFAQKLYMHQQHLRSIMARD